ncbi:MAG: hypothetical protein WDO12_15240 [Pseudomonadota bacterium]
MNIAKTLRRTALPALLLAAFAAPALTGAPPPAGPAPQFHLDSMAGKPVDLSQFKGQVVMLNSGRAGAARAAPRCPSSRSCTRSTNPWASPWWA